MLSAILLVTGLVLAGPTKEELPKFWDQYPIETTANLFKICMSAGEDLGHDRDKMEGFCTCHIFVLTETTTFSEFNSVRKAKKLGPLFDRLSQMCVSMGFEPGEAKKNRKPKPPPAGTVQL